MKRQIMIQRFILWLGKKLGLLEKKEISKEEMCKRAVESGVCPKACDRCAWNRRIDHERIK